MRDFILRSVRDRVEDVGALTARQFGVSRTTVSNYLKRLIAEGHLEATGKTNARSFKIKPFISLVDREVIGPDSEEDVIWRDKLFPHMHGVPQNVIDICQHGFTEMYNNVIDHSDSENCLISLQRTYFANTISVRDYGVGIFAKIRHHFNLLDRRHALLELSKGKLTSSHANHTGEGIFFTSRMFDDFAILSLDLSYLRHKEGQDDWLIQVDSPEHELKGTLVLMTISNDASWTTTEVFNRYVDDNDRFSKTNVPINLARYEGEQLVSRSQARRILARVDRFSDVLLDFAGVPTIGQAFADEIFRVFQREHPQMHLYAIRATDDVLQMIHHAIANAEREKENIAEPPLPGF